MDFDPRDDLGRTNGVWKMGSTDAAELVKLAKTTYRDVNIGVANQFAKLAKSNGIDVRLVIDACNSQAFSHLHKPGITVVGHCIPVYSRLYLRNEPAATVVSAARSANAGMPGQVVERTARRLGDLRGLSVAIFSSVYRGGLKEAAFSGVFPLADELHQGEATVSVHDLLFSDEEFIDLGFLTYHRVDPADVIVIRADHSEYATWGSDSISGVRPVSKWSQCHGPIKLAE